jgi:hypothetical protein
MDLPTDLYLSPPYPEVTFLYKHQSIGLYGPFIPSGQGHFAEQPLDQNGRQPFTLPPQDSPVLLRNNAQLDAYNPYGVSGILLEAPQDPTLYNPIFVVEPVSGYNDFGINTGFVNGVIPFLRPAYSKILKTSAFFKASGIINNQAHPLALDAATSGGRFHYLSNAYYYISTKADFVFAPYLIMNRNNYPPTQVLGQVSQSGLANNIRTISMTSGVITEVLTY